MGQVLVHLVVRISPCPCPRLPRVSSLFSRVVLSTRLVIIDSYGVSNHLWWLVSSCRLFAHLFLVASFRLSLRRLFLVASCCLSLRLLPVDSYFLSTRLLHVDSTPVSHPFLNVDFVSVSPWSLSC